MQTGERSLPWKCGSVSGGNCTTQLVMVNYISKKSIFKDILLQKTNSEKKMMKRKVIGFLPGDNELPATLRAISVEFCLSLKVNWMM